MVHSFNLIDQAWIPLSNGDHVSIRDVFSPANNHQQIGGNTITQISIFKLLQAIAQVANPVDEDTYSEMTIDEFSENCLNYLNKWHSRFDLYDNEHPFLQFPSLADYPAIPFEKLSTYKVASDSEANRTVLNHFQLPQESYSDIEKAQILIAQQAMAFGGKGISKANKKPIALAKGLEKKSSACVGSSLGNASNGYMHSFIFGNTLLESLFINVITQEEIADMSQFSEGFGVPVWQEMPSTELCPVSTRLKNSLFGRLIPMNRFCLLKDNMIVIIEGVVHLNYKDGIADPSMTLITEKKDMKVLLARVTKGGWRNADAILSFLDTNKTSKICPQVMFGLDHAKMHGLSKAHLVSMGVQITFNAGEYYLAKTDDFVKSDIFIDPRKLDSLMYARLSKEWQDLEKFSYSLQASLTRYFQTLIDQNCASKSARKKTDEKLVEMMRVYWADVAQYSQCLIDSVIDNSQEAKALQLNTRKKLISLAKETYQSVMPSSAKQLKAWTINKPYFQNYLKELEA